MNKEPRVSKYLDDEERDLIAAIEAEDYVPESVKTPEMISEHESFARNTINEESIKVSLRIPHTDLARVKARALKEGLPYQTLIKSIIHKAVSR